MYSSKKLKKIIFFSICMKSNISKLLKWKNVFMEIKNPNIVFLDNKIISTFFNKFWSQEIDSIKKKNIINLEDYHIIILTRIKWDNNDYITLGNLQKLNIVKSKNSNIDKQWYIEHLIALLEQKSETYQTKAITKIVFSFGFRKGKIEAKPKFTINLPKYDPNFINYLNYSNYKLPLTMNPLQYGILIVKLQDNVYIIQINKTNIAHITSTYNSDNKLIENNIKIYKSGHLILSYKDKVHLNQEDNTILSFYRYIGTNQYVITLNNETKLYNVDLHLTEKLVRFIQKDKIKSNKKTTSKLLISELEHKTLNNFIVMDIETVKNKDNQLNPIILSVFEGEKLKSYYAKDYKDLNEMFKICFEALMLRKYKGYSVYLHNFANFDAIFILKILINLGTINPIIHNGKIISIEFLYGPNKEYKLIFKDSYHILPASLKKLAKSFNTNQYQKDIFPFDFVNENNLDYIGKVPDFSYFNNISEKDYNNYKNKYDNNWSLKTEFIKYCEQDCLSLYNVLSKFNLLIFNLFNLNIHKYPTLPSLSFGIYRNNYLKANTIPQISGKLYENIKLSYTGGSCDMYKPIFKKENKNQLLYYYDVNSLYPFVMKINPMPIGKPTYFEGEIRKYNPNAFGFFYCNIISPKYLEHPILQTHIKINNSIRTISPLTNLDGYKDWIFSEEMKNAEKFGYKFEIICGYIFKKDYIFTEFINDLYNLRLNYDKNNPFNYIAKILMNSHYGRYGMNNQYSNIKLIPNDKLDKYINDEIINLVGPLKDDLYWIQYKSLLNKEITNLDFYFQNNNINIAIASAISAYARIHMTQFKNNPNFNLYYTDTDCIFIDTPLPNNFISDTELGKMKLETICDQAIFLAPKSYILIPVDKQKTPIVKMKGLINPQSKLNINDFNNLLEKNISKETTNLKWFKNMFKGTINIKEEIYSIMLNNNKRQLIFDDNNKLKNTKPYRIDNNKNIINKI